MEMWCLHKIIDKVQETYESEISVKKGLSMTAQRLYTFGPLSRKKTCLLRLRRPTYNKYSTHHRQALFINFISICLLNSVIFLQTPPFPSKLSVHHHVQIITNKHRCGSNKATK